MTTTTDQTLDEIRTAVQLQAALQAIVLGALPIMSTDRSIPRKEQAKLARMLFKQLGLKGISVRAPNYSQAQSVDVRLPKREDYERDQAGCIDWPNDPAAIANNAAEKRVREILNRAFPNHDDRSDSQSDHFNYCWSVD